MKLKDVQFKQVNVFSLPEFHDMLFVRNERGIIHGYTIKEFISKVVCTEPTKIPDIGGIENG